MQGTMRDFHEAGKNFQKAVSETQKIMKHSWDRVIVSDGPRNFQEAQGVKDDGQVRKFATGALRDTATDKLDFEGFLDPAVLEAYAKYMHFNRRMLDGSMRDSDNWQKGFGLATLVKSLIRHAFDLWDWHRQSISTKHARAKGFQNPMLAACGVLFNTMGYIREFLIENPDAMEEALRVAELERAQRRRVIVASPEGTP